MSTAPKLQRFYVNEVREFVYSVEAISEEAAMAHINSKPPYTVRKYAGHQRIAVRLKPSIVNNRVNSFNLF